MKTEITMNFAAFTVTDNVYCYDQEINRCIDRLVELKDYINALQICSITARDTTEIILAQVYSLINSFNFSLIIVYYRIIFM